MLFPEETDPLSTRKVAFFKLSLQFQRIIQRALETLDGLIGQHIRLGEVIQICEDLRLRLYLFIQIKGKTASFSDRAFH